MRSKFHGSALRTEGIAIGNLISLRLAGELIKSSLCALVTFYMNILRQIPPSMCAGSFFFLLDSQTFASANRERKDSCGNDRQATEPKKNTRKNRAAKLIHPPTTNSAMISDVSASIFFPGAAPSVGKHRATILAFVSRSDCFLRCVCHDVLHMHDDDRKSAFSLHARHT